MLPKSPAHQLEGPRNHIKSLAVGLLLILFYVPYIRTGHIQEDAYITFRCARNFATSGFFSFNPPRKDAGVTCPTYAFIAAAAYRFFGEHAIWLMQVFGVLCVLLGLHVLLSRLIRNDGIFLRTWFLASLLPVSLRMGCSGMETAFLFLVIATLFSLIGEEKKTLRILLLLILLPTIRMDSIAFGCVFLLFHGLSLKRVPWLGACALSLGMGLAATYNFAYFGSVIPLSARAKAAAYHPEMKFTHLLTRFASVVWGPKSYLLPIGTTHLGPFAPLNALVFGVLMVFSVKAFSAPRRRESRMVFFAMTAASVSVPAAYAFGGVIAKWYLWIPTLLLQVIALWWASSSLSTLAFSSLRRKLVFLLYGFTFALAMGQLALSTSAGIQEQRYRAAVGRDIHRLASSTDTLLLEPAGYIPYFAQIFTWEDVGICSPEVLSYHLQYRGDWFMRFIKEKRPVFIVRRASLTHTNADYRASLTSEDKTWLDGNYQLIKSYRYDPKVLAKTSFERFVTKWGSHSDYHLYRLSVES